MRPNVTIKNISDWVSEVYADGVLIATITNDGASNIEEVSIIHPNKDISFCLQGNDKEIQSQKNWNHIIKIEEFEEGVSIYIRHAWPESYTIFDYMED